MKPQAIYYKTALGGKELTFETGRLANKPAVLAILRQGDSSSGCSYHGGVREGTDFSR